MFQLFLFGLLGTRGVLHWTAKTDVIGFDGRFINNYKNNVIHNPKNTTGNIEVDDLDNDKNTECETLNQIQENMVKLSYLSQLSASPFTQKSIGIDELYKQMPFLTTTTTPHWSLQLMQGFYEEDW